MRRTNPNSVSIGDPNLDWKEWNRQNLKLTFAGFYVWIAPEIGMFACGNFWKLSAVLSIALGAALSRGLWRRLLAGAWLIGLVALGRSPEYLYNGQGIIPPELLLFGVVGFYVTYYADGQARKREMEEQEEPWRR
jgi:hypothetical protein